MRHFPGRVAEVQLHSGQASALIACPPEGVPVAGQYLLATKQGSIQTTPLFLADKRHNGFLASPPYPENWRPGTELSLFGPLGKGFHLPTDIQRLALFVLGDTNARLLPLARAAAPDRYQVTLTSDAPLADLPSDLEVYPLNGLQESLSWADFFAIDAPLARLESLVEHFNNLTLRLSTIRGQVLVQSPMPCSTLGQCGVCAVKVKRSWKLTCKEGPVFDLQGILKGFEG